MPHLLKNNVLEVRIDLPTEHYQLSRFDWTGKITTVTFKGMYVSGTEFADLTEDPFCGKGFYNEFGIDAPLGYEETEKGDWFHKIGIGLLKKEEDTYDFHKRYAIQQAEFNVALGPDSIRFRCQSPLHHGYAYVLEKEICLLDSGFEIRYHLANTGGKPIMTNEYNHNFLSIDNSLIGSAYRLQVPFELKPYLFGEQVNPEQVVEIGQRNVQFTGTPNQPFFFSHVSGGETVEAGWKLEHTARKIGISETGDFQTSQVNLWGWGHVISPELFIHLHIEPGQSRDWTRTYQVYEIS